MTFAKWLVVNFGRIEGREIVIEVPDTLDPEKCFDRLLRSLNKEVS